MSYLPQDIQSELDKLDVLLNKIHIAKDTPNMSDLELKALFNLKDRDDVVLKKADKDNAIVIMDRDDYIREAHNQIFNDEYYKFMFNTLRPRQNDRHFPDDTFKCIFMNEKLCI